MSTFGLPEPGGAAREHSARLVEFLKAAIRHELEGNICRCTGYHNIVKAVEAGAKAMGGTVAAGIAAE